MNNRFMVILVSCVWVAGCASAPRYRGGAEYATFFKTAKKIAVMPMDIKVNQLSAGGMAELMDEWTADAKEKVKQALTDAFASYPLIQLVFIDESALNGDDKALVKEQLGMYNALFASIVEHTYAPGSTFRHKLKNFDYTFGPDIGRLSSLMQADAYLFCSGSNYIWTTGRANLAAFGFIVGAITGVVITPSCGPEWLSLALADAQTGNIVWFDFLPHHDDMRQLTRTRSLVKKLLETLPPHAS